VITSDFDIIEGGLEDFPNRKYGLALSISLPKFIKNKKNILNFMDSNSKTTPT